MVPSQTELLFYLGLDSRIVGVTKFCIHPAQARTTRAVIGGTKNPNLEQIRYLKPDFVLANKEENDRASIEVLRREFPVWVSDITTLEDAYQMMAAVGNLTDTSAKAMRLVADLKTTFSQLPNFGFRKALYLIWRKPYMAAACQTFIDSMLAALRLRNVLASTRYPELSLDEIQQLDPDFIFLSSEPYPFSTKHIQEIQQVVPTARIVLVDGELFSWYGSRLLAAPTYFQELFKALMPTDSKSNQNEG